MDEESERQRIETEKKKWGDRTDEWLCDAAMRGDVGSLMEITANDKYILDKVLVGGFKGKNPLHVAISTGQREFALELLTAKSELAEVLDAELGTALHIASSKGHLEIVKLLANIDKPELAEVLDAELGAALHIASSKGHLEIVKHLVAVSPGMCMARNREGNNPLHIAAMKGKVEVLKVLLRTSPQAAQVRVDQGYTILHLCVNYNQLESLNELLIKFEDPDFVASTDTYGNNILHLAVFGNQYEIVEHVLRNTKIDVNARNGSGWTALDIYSRAAESEDPNIMDHRIRGILRKNGAKRSAKLFFPHDPSWQNKKKETLIIVSSLFATIAFQVGVNPPGGVWQDTSKPEDTFKPHHVAGKSITATYYPNAFYYFVYFNTVGFLLSLTTILDLIVSFSAKNKAIEFIGAGISWLTIMTMAFTYTFSVIVVSPSVSDLKPYSVGRMVIPNILALVIVWAVLVSFIRKLHLYYKETLVFVLGFFLFGLPGGLGMMLILWLARMVRKCAKRNRASEGTGQSPRDRASELTVQSPRDTDSTSNPNAVRENESRVMIMP